ncbi:MAG: hypothetical protein PHQ59_04965 [Candidatus Daviesbacteria bacterium]|nr:hypothetical protein [Candidatus Daviesbacteria bacterium]
MREKGSAHLLIVIAITILLSLFISIGISIPQQQSLPTSKLQNVLGEKIGPCSSGSLTTWTNPNKTYQGYYPNETFQQLTNIDLLKDMSQLKDMTCLQYLDSTDRVVKGDIENLKNLINLEVLTPYSNPDVGGDICSLANATKLRIIKFAFDPKITGDIACLKNLTKLENFAMTHTNISGDISVFANMPNLKALYLSGTYVKGDICALKNLTNLQELGIADEYPGNPDITGDLSCLNNLKNLKRVSIYNTKTTNCEVFEKTHQGMEKTITESGKQGGGGCSKESMKTLVDYAQKFEAKIGKQVQTEVRGQPNYNKGEAGGLGSGDRNSEIKDDRNFFQKLISMILSFFGIRAESPGGSSERVNDRGGGDRGPMPEGAVGPGGCKSQAECDKYCDQHKDECSKFTPPGGR